MRRLARDPPGSAVFAAREEPGGDLYEIGTIGRVAEFGERSCCGHPLAVIEGLARTRSTRIQHHPEFSEASCEAIEDAPESPAHLQALVLGVAEVVHEFHQRFPRCHHAERAASRLREGARAADVPGAVQDLLLSIPVVDRQRVLEATPLSARLEATLELLTRAASRAWSFVPVPGEPTLH